MFSLVNRCSSIWIVFCMAHTVQICSIWRITDLLILNMCTNSHGIVMIGESLMLGSHSGFVLSAFKGLLNNKCHYSVATQPASINYNLFVCIYRC